MTKAERLQRYLAKADKASRAGDRDGAEDENLVNATNALIASEQAIADERKQAQQDVQTLTADLRAVGAVLGFGPSDDVDLAEMVRQRLALAWQEIALMQEAERGHRGAILRAVTTQCKHDAQICRDRAERWRQEHLKGYDSLALAAECDNCAEAIERGDSQ